MYREVVATGHDCAVVAPSLIPRKSGDRVKTVPRRAAAETLGPATAACGVSMSSPAAVLWRVCVTFQNPGNSVRRAAGTRVGVRWTATGSSSWTTQMRYIDGRTYPSRSVFRRRVRFPPQEHRLLAFCSQSAPEPVQHLASADPPRRKGQLTTLPTLLILGGRWGAAPCVNACRQSRQGRGKPVPITEPSSSRKRPVVQGQAETGGRV